MLPVLNAVPRVSPPDRALQAESDSDPDVRQAIQRLANNDRTLVWLRLNGRKIDDNGVRVLADALARNTSLTTLDLGYNRIGDRGAEALAGALAQSQSLTGLDLNDNKIGSIGARALAYALVQNISLTSLDLGRNRCFASGARALAQALEQNSSLTALGLNGSKVGVRERAVIHAALARNHQAARSKAQTLFQRGQQFAAEGKYHLAEDQFRQALRLGIKAEERRLIQAALDQAVQRPIAVPRVGTTPLESVGDLDVRQAIQRLAVNDRTLTALNLNDKKIGYSDARALADALAQNTSLTTLSLGYNQIGDRSTLALAGAMARSRSLTALELNDNQIRDGGAQALASALALNRGLTTLDLSRNMIHVNGAQALAGALAVRTSLTTLRMSMNRIGGRERAAIHTALARNYQAVRTESQTLFQRGQQLAAEGEYQLAGEQFRQALRLGIDTEERSLIQTALDQAIQGLADNDAVLAALDLCLKEINGSDA